MPDRLCRIPAPVPDEIDSVLIGESSMWQSTYERISRNPLLLAALTGCGWELAAVVVARASFLIAGIVIARTLGESEFGAWGIVLALLGVFAQFGSFNISSVCTRYVAELRHRDPQRVGEIVGFAFSALLVFGGGATLACILSADLVARFVFQSPSLAPLLFYGGLCVGVTLASGVFRAILAGCHRFLEAASIDAVQGVCYVCGIPIVLAFWRNTSAVLCMYAAATSVACVFAWVRSMRALKAMSIKIVFHRVLREKDLILHFGVPGLVMAATEGPADAYSRSIVARLPGGLAAMGGVQAAAQWQSLVVFVPALVARVMTPVMASVRGDGDWKRFTKYVLLSGTMALAAATSLALPVALFGKWILGWYGDGFVDYYPVMLVLILAGTIEAIASALVGLYAILDVMWWRTSTVLMSQFVLVALSIALVPRIGAAGFACAIAGQRAMQLSVLIVVSIRRISQETSRAMCRRSRTLVAAE